MDPLTSLLVGIGINVGTDVWRRIWNGSQQAVASRSTGSAFVGGSYNDLLDTSWLVTHTVTVDYEAGDDWVAEWIDANNPCLFVVVADEFVQVVPCTIEDRFVLDLPHGRYEIGLLVYDEHLVAPDLMELVAWQVTAVWLGSDQHVVLPIRTDPELAQVLTVWDEVIDTTTDALRQLTYDDELSIDAYDEELDVRIFVPDSQRASRARVEALLENPELQDRAHDAEEALRELGFGVKEQSGGAIRVRTHVNLRETHEIEDLVLRLWLILWKIFDVDADDVNIRWVL